MEVLLRKYRELHCCLCGEKGMLTSEHKIKAAMLKQEFGKEQLAIQRSDGSEQGAKIAQGVKSKHLKFEASICKTCNSSRTQLPDCEFDRFSKLALQKCRLGENPHSLLGSDGYQMDSPSYLNLHRYFAKLLCCHLTVLKAPIPIRLSEFSIGKSSSNCVVLEVGRSWNYEQMENFLGKNIQYADHGGLLLQSNGLANGLAAILSTTALGPLQYSFLFSLDPNERLEIEDSHREFHDSCCAQFQISIPANFWPFIF
jgi:hypothetical protein